MEYSEIDRKLQKILTPKRYTHTKGVEYTAACLAMKYGADIEKARIAGLLHDNAKCLDSEEMLKKAKKYGVRINDAEKANPDLLHAIIGAYRVKDKFEINDNEIIKAVMYHTTGHPNMSLMEKIIYIADYIEPNRKPIPEIEEIRKESFTDIDKALWHILNNTLDYLKHKNVYIEEESLLAYKYYSKGKN